MDASLSEYIEVAQKWALQHTPVSAQAAGCLIHQLCDEIERYLWIPVGKRLPESGEAVLVWFHGEVRMAWFNYLANGVAYFVCDTHYNFEPTHWMPLPAPPTDAK